MLENELQLATGDAAKAEAARRFDVPVDEVPEATVSAESKTEVLVFTASADDPESAATIANAWAEPYLPLSREQTDSSITAAVIQLEERLVGLHARREEASDGGIVLVDAQTQWTAVSQLRVSADLSRATGRG